MRSKGGGAALSEACDVLVIGGGNAALCAALAARESGADVLLLERSPRAERGGNSRFTAGAMRFAYEGLDDLLTVAPDLNEDEKRTTDFGCYTREQFFADMWRLTDYRAQAELVRIVIDESLDTVRWLRSHGVRFIPLYGAQAYNVDDKFTFWGGLVMQAVGGGPGLVEALYASAATAGIRAQYRTRALSLRYDGGRVTGARVTKRGGSVYDISAGAVVLASGGFEANVEWRARYLGPGWDLAKVRGTPYNTGDGIRMALEIGAMPYGHWSGCHAVAWDRNAPETGDLAVGDAFQKHSYPFGIVVNARGQRFVDEGADFRNFTYAKYGRAILEQPGQYAWQIFDGKVLHLLRSEYRIPQVTRVTADTIEELAQRLDDVDTDGLLTTIGDFNAAVRKDIPFNPNIKDGRCTERLAVPKSNWATTIDEPPFEAYGVTCGITFTFGGVRVDRKAQVRDGEGSPIQGLYAAGELVGGLFYSNYPGGTGLMAGAVLGRAAGRSAALAAGRRWAGSDP